MPESNGWNQKSMPKSESRSTSPISTVDLFCGAGGLTKGLEKVVVPVRLGVDVDPACGRTVSLSFRVTPSFARLLERAAAHENRSKTNLVETLVLPFCRERGIETDGQAGPEEPVVKSSRAHSELD